MDRDSFLKTILANPDDDGVRLAYSDWLMEQCNDDDEARAELIRVQIEIANWKPYQPDPVAQEIAASERLYAWQARKMLENLKIKHDLELHALKLRSQQLLEKHGEYWLKDFPCRRDANQCTFSKPEDTFYIAGIVPISGAMVGVVGIRFKRGFVEEVLLGSQRWLFDHFDAAIAQQPIRTVVLMISLDTNRLLHHARSQGEWKEKATDELLRYCASLGIMSGTFIGRELLRICWPSIKDWKVPRDDGTNHTENIEQLNMARTWLNESVMNQALGHLPIIRPAVPLDPRIVIRPVK